MLRRFGVGNAAGLDAALQKAATAGLVLSCVYAPLVTGELRHEEIFSCAALMDI